MQDGEHALHERDVAVAAPRFGQRGIDVAHCRSGIDAVALDEGEVGVAAQAGAGGDADAAVDDLGPLAERVALDVDAEALDQFFAGECGGEMERGEEAGAEIAAMRDDADLPLGGEVEDGCAWR